MVEIKMEMGLTSTGKASVNMKVDRVTGTETTEEIKQAEEIAIRVFNDMKQVALQEYGFLNNEIGGKK